MNHIKTIQKRVCVYLVVFTTMWVASSASDKYCYITVWGSEIDPFCKYKKGSISLPHTVYIKNE